MTIDLYGCVQPVEAEEIQQAQSKEDQLYCPDD